MGGWGSALTEGSNDHARQENYGGTPAAYDSSQDAPTTSLPRNFPTYPCRHLSYRIIREPASTKGGHASVLAKRLASVTALIFGMLDGGSAARHSRATSVRSVWRLASVAP